MAVRNLDAAKAFSSGSPLWFVADLKSSTWSRKIDWYLNFQFAAAEIKTSPHVSTELNEISQRWDFEIPVIVTSEDINQMPLMIASSQLLPNNKTVMVPFTESSLMPDDASQSNEHWVEQCHQVWQNLGRPAARIFLPDHVSAEVVTRHWPKAGSPTKKPTGKVVQSAGKGAGQNAGNNFNLSGSKNFEDFSELVIDVVSHAELK